MSYDLSFDEIKDVIEPKRTNKNPINQLKFDLIDKYFYKLINHILTERGENKLNSKEINNIWEFILSIYWAKNSKEMNELEKWLDACPLDDIYNKYSDVDFFKTGSSMYELITVTELNKVNNEINQQIKEMLNSCKNQEDSIEWYIKCPSLNVTEYIKNTDRFKKISNLINREIFLKEKKNDPIQGI